MDNFMDKLSKRFNAGEIIQANGEAEAKEMQRMRQQMSEYEKVIQEVRRLNLKTAEMSEQVSQMLASGIEQFEAYAHEKTQLELNSMQENAVEEKLHQSNEEMLAEIMQLRNDLTTQSQMLSNLMLANEALHAQITEKTDTLSQQVMSGLQDVKAGQGANNDEKDALRQAQLDDMLRQMSLQQRELSDAMENRMAGMALRVDNTEASMKREVVDASYRVEASISELRQNILQELSREKNSAQDEFAVKTVDTLEKIVKAQEESSKQLKEMIVNLRLYLDEVQKHIEDYVHKEDVKVYRNVQANFAEQMTNRFRDVGDQLGSLDRDVSKNKGTKALLIVTFLVATASVALQVVQILGLL